MSDFRRGGPRRPSFDRPSRFDDDGGFGRSPRPARPRVTPHTERVSATVKWFNAAKGFGFVTGPGGDAFLPGSILRDAGLDGVADGATVVVDIGTGEKGEVVTRVHSAEGGSAASAPRPGGGMGGGMGGGGMGGGMGGRGPLSPAGEVEGTVKWFNATKGFGFVAPDGGGKDVFVHANALRRSGIADLPDGARVRVSTVHGQKGVEADRVELLD